MSKNCPIIAIDDAPQVNNTPPSKQQWLELHELANKFRRIYTVVDFALVKKISFFLQFPDSKEIIRVCIFTKRLKAIVIEADFLSSSLSHLLAEEIYLDDITHHLGRHFLSIAFVNKNQLTKKELALREELQLESPGKKRLHYVSITEKRPGLPPVLIDQSDISLIKHILTFACRNFNDPSFKSINMRNPFIFKAQSGENFDHLKSWKKSHFKLPSLAEYYNIPLTEETVASQLSLSPQTWTIHSHFVPTNCPCPDGYFQPLLLSFLHSQTEEFALPDEKPLLISFKNDLIKDLVHLNQAIVHSLETTLAEVSEKPTHILTSSPLVYLVIQQTLQTLGISLIFVNDDYKTPYTSDSFIYDFLHTPEDHIYLALGYPLIEKTKAVLHINLDDVSPPVTRTIEIAGNTSLAELHHAIQSVMDWNNEHPHEFFIQSSYQTIHFSEEELSLERECFIKPTDSTTLNSLYQTGFKKLTYLYDFGDNWKHSLSIRSLTPSNTPPKSPIVIKSQGDCPGENSRCAWR